MFNQELSVADDSEEEYDDGPIAVRSAAPKKVSAAAVWRACLLLRSRSAVPPLTAANDSQAELQVDELSDLRSTFEACDSDKSGGMDLSELTTVLRLWGVEEDAQTLATDLIITAKQGYGKMGGSTKSEFQDLVTSIGMPWDLEDPEVDDMELSFPEFLHLMVSGVRRHPRRSCGAGPGALSTAVLLLRTGG